MAKNQINIFNVLKSSELFGALDDDLVLKLEGIIQKTKINKNRMLFSQGDKVNGCYIILDGTIKISLIESEGEESLLAVLGIGDIVGEMGVVSGRKRSADATALKDCSLGYLSISNFERIADDNPVIYRKLLGILCNRLKATNQNFINQRLSLSERLARTLINLSQSFGSDLPDGRICIKHKITQVELGRMTNTSRENINRQLKVWRDDGLLSQISGYYCLSDISDWKNVARLDDVIDD